MARVTHQDSPLDIGTARDVASRRLLDVASMGAVNLQGGRIQLRNRGAL